LASFRVVEVEGDGDAIAFNLANSAFVTWTSANRLVVTEWTDTTAGVSFSGFSTAADGSDKQGIDVVIEGRLESAPRCSPDGRRLAYVTASTTGSRTVHLLDLTNSNDFAIALPDRDPPPASGTNFGSYSLVTVSWSPDSAQLAVRISPPSVEDRLRQSELDNLTLLDADETEPVWTGVIRTGDEILWRPGS